MLTHLEADAEVEDVVWRGGGVAFPAVGDGVPAVLELERV